MSRRIDPGVLNPVTEQPKAASDAGPNIGIGRMLVLSAPQLIDWRGHRLIWNGWRQIDASIFFYGMWHWHSEHGWLVSSYPGVVSWGLMGAGFMVGQHYTQDTQEYLTLDDPFDKFEQCKQEALRRLQDEIESGSRPSWWRPTLPEADDPFPF